MIQLQVPELVYPEATYVAKWILEERFGLECTISPGEKWAYELRLGGVPGGIEAPCAADGSARFPYLKITPGDVPPLELEERPPLPVWFGKPTWQIDSSRHSIGFDLFGTIFWLISRSEELRGYEPDQHDRFSSASSILGRCGLLDRPIADEYVEFLWRMMTAIWPNLERKKQTSTTFITCDVDAPFCPSSRSTGVLLRRIASDLLRDRSPALALSRIRNVARVKGGDFSLDPHNTFGWMMDRCEAAGLKSAFYFICGRSAGRKDGYYSVDDPFVRKLMREMHDRGHELGLHASYNSFLDAAQTRREFDVLLSTCRAQDIRQNCWGGRQHYLRWRTPETAWNLNEAGLDYDSTLGFADHAGFRCGTCHSFRLWDWRNRCPMRLRERPLVVMEASVIAQRYMGLGYTAETEQCLKRLKHQCHQYAGEFVVLWHNSHLENERDRTLFVQLL